MEVFPRYAIAVDAILKQQIMIVWLTTKVGFKEMH